MFFLATFLLGTGVLLIFTWFGTRKKMIDEGKWEEEGRAGAYTWLGIYIAMIVLGLYLALKP